MIVTNSDLCDILYRIRDLINQGKFDHAVALTDTLKKELVYAYVQNVELRCETTCIECEKECK